MHDYPKLVHDFLNLLVNQFDYPIFSNNFLILFRIALWASGISYILDNFFIVTTFITTELKSILGF